ncbi:AAA family ATP:ADP antiporter [Methylobacterium sp. PvP062]|uniref:AAA family ATP:ADP antiporter n=1 Tax=Methylobacterium radiotolerans TaxID=31998 RepID=A0ABV2NBH4_9HYPH|nr:MULTISPECIES: MFS transporter [Methylobacterium]MCX7333266.1 MFS transporter [Hyphomicrobiales bacterium]KTS03038.1 MFS transporter [Methylobacterium radiotolerans]MBP2492916.1 AAA family ATP:ADP antiporter [Methylobacterium sp. PvP105]MBP2500712.1 AAA family ATP:ADP antiporter [Methylobacterium sp. PvP109]MDE3745804.1 MFS transporter [Methylobacterium radiotolerans]
MPESAPARGTLARLIDVQPGEGRALAWSWAYIFSILAAYYVLRPIRDQMGVAGGIENLPWLFTATLVGMLALNLPFAYLVKRMPRARFVPITYRFFAANILAFALTLYLAPPEWGVWIGRVFFVWLSIFNLFVVSIFWATIVDVFSNAQGKRLFGFIAAGATLGAIAGSATTAILAKNVPTWGLMLCAVVLLEVAVFCMRGLSALSTQLHEVPGSHGGVADGQDRTIGGSVLAGVTRTLASPYLINISLFLLLFSVTSTFLYFEQAGIAKRSFPDRGAQTAFFASVDLAVNVLTLGIQLFLTGRIVNRIGVALTLAILPAFSILGFAALALWPTIGVIVAFQVLRRAGNFAIARPVREVLFTVVPREDRYKAKSFIDTVVYRLGDQVGAWSFTGIQGIGLGSASVAGAAIPLSMAWLVNSVWLGRAQERRRAEQAALSGSEPERTPPIVRAAASSSG